MKNKIRKDFTQIPNNLINDPEISRDARFLFVYLCSKSDDWKFFNKKIEKDLGCSKDTRIKYMKELIERGWISVSQTKKETGEWGGNEIELNCTPSGTFKESPCPKNTDTVKHGSGKTTPHTNTNLNTNTKKENIYISPAGNFEEYTPTQFLKRWSDARIHYDNLPTHITRLKTNDLNIFNQLVKDYSARDFDKAIEGLFTQKTYPAVRLQPSHFLDNFEKYLTCGRTGEKLFETKAKKKDNTGMI